MARVKLLDEIIGSGPQDVLKRHGFGKKRRAFYRYCGEIFQFVHFFPSQWTGAEITSFTLSVGVTVRYWHQHTSPPEQMITDLVPLLGRRFGPDLDHPIGQFWMTDSVEPAAQEVVERLERHALPWLMARSSEGSVAQQLLDTRADDPIVGLCALARIHLRTGRRADVSRVLSEARKELGRLGQTFPNRPDVVEAYRSMITTTEEWIGMAEPSVAPDGGPAPQLGNSGVTEGPPSVSSFGHE